MHLVPGAAEFIVDVGLEGASANGVFDGVEHAPAGGGEGGFFAVGRVVNVEDDPTQSGQVKVMWFEGSASQDRMSEEDLPWTRVLFPATNPWAAAVVTVTVALLAARVRPFAAVRR